jgi:hypothetical protein
MPGVGAVFVLAPRALPVRRVKSADGQAARSLAEALTHLQVSLRRVREPELRVQIERSLEAVRQAQVELHGTPPRPRPVWTVLPPMPEIAAEVEAALAAQERALREAEQGSREMSRAFREQWQAEMRALNAQTDAFRVEAERVQQEAERILQEQLQAWPGFPVPVAAPVPDAPAPPAAVAVPATPGAPGAPPAAPMAPAAAATPPKGVPPAVAPPRPPAAPPPPWSVFFEPDDTADAGDADQVVGDVRAAVLGVLETHGPRLARLGPEDSVVVAVDFVPRAVRPGQSVRTLVLRVRKKDLDERQAGRLPTEDFARRVQAAEY